MNLLLLEDDEQLSKSIARLLRKVGHEVVPVKDVGTAVAALEAGGIDVIVADVGLQKGESGTDLLRLARDRFPSVFRVIASGMPNVDVASPTAPWQAYLGKPYGLSELRDVLGRAEAAKAMAG